jgi:hypothetical protein
VLSIATWFTPQCSNHSDKASRSAKGAGLLPRWRHHTGHHRLFVHVQATTALVNHTHKIVLPLHSRRAGDLLIGEFAIRAPFLPGLQLTAPSEPALSAAEGSPTSVLGSGSRRQNSSSSYASRGTPIFICYGARANEHRCFGTGPFIAAFLFLRVAGGSISGIFIGLVGAGVVVFTMLRLITLRKELIWPIGGATFAFIVGLFVLISTDGTIGELLLVYLDHCGQVARSSP